MSKRCAKCEKTVYPTEEFKCLDKVWHKGCFRCTECSLALNMKTYKGYNKLPYCNTHYPKTNFTAVAETPEMARIAQNTKIQSNIHYHKEFESGKGKYTDVGTDNPEIARHLKNQQKISSVVYHAQHEKDKAKYTQVADDPELLRHLQNTKTSSLLSYHEDHEKGKGRCIQVADDKETQRLQQMQERASQVQYQQKHRESLGQYTTVEETPEIKRMKQSQELSSQNLYQQKHRDSLGKYTPVVDDPEMLRLMKNQALQSQIKYHEDFEKNIKGTKIQVADDPETARIRKNMATVSQVEYKGLRKQHDVMEDARTKMGGQRDGTRQVVYRNPPDATQPPPPTDSMAAPSPYSSRNSGTSTVYTSAGKVEQQGQQKRVGSIHDYDPLNNQFGSISQDGGKGQQKGQWQETVQMPQGYGATSHDPPGEPDMNGGPVEPPRPATPPREPTPPPAPTQGPMVQLGQPLNLTVTQPEAQQQQQQAYHPPPAGPPAEPAQPPAPAAPKGFRCKALYDYEAGDDDEVGFKDGDVIMNCEPIDDGWMFGTVERTGRHGMLPANYVEKI